MLNGKFTIYPILGPSVCPSQVIFVNISIAYKISFFNKKEVAKSWRTQAIFFSDTGGVEIESSPRESVQ